LAETLPQLQRGSVVRASVTGLREYGVFLELEGGLPGLLHISQISYDRVERGLDKMFSMGQKLKVMVLDYDKQSGKVALSTKALENTPGDMLRDPENVYLHAEEMALKYHERVEAERKLREDAAKDIVAGLGDAIEGKSELVSVAESIESILASIVNDNNSVSK
jgi:small subunit ribosomal protein S1